jgi:hypothetical protein
MYSEVLSMVIRLRKALPYVFLWTLLALSWDSRAFGFEKLRFALAVETGYGLTAVDADNVRNNLNSQLVGSAGIDLFERTRIKAVWDELQLQDSAVFDPNTAVKLGKMIGVQYVVMASLVILPQKKSNKEYDLSITVTEVKTSQVVFSKIVEKIASERTLGVKLAAREGGEALRHFANDLVRPSQFEPYENPGRIRKNRS